MSTNNPSDAWALESEESKRNGEEVNPDQSKQNIEEDRPAEVERDPWELEKPFSRLIIKQITPATPKELQEKLAWRAIRHAIETSEHEEDILDKVLAWNANNDPKLDEETLREMTRWALDHWPNKFRGTQ